MIYRNKKGFIGIDILIVIIIFMLFSTLLIFLIKINLKKNVDLQYKALTNIYLTEISENIAICNFSNLIISDNTSDNKNILPIEFDENGNSTNNHNIKIQLKVEETTVTQENFEYDIAKLVTIDISYVLDNKTYSATFNKTKLKE